MHRRPAWIGAIAVAAAFGLLGAMGRTGQGQPPTPARGPSLALALALGKGSAAAFPFGAGNATSAGYEPSHQGPAPWSDPASDLPSAIIALGDESVPHALDRLGALARRGDVRAAADAYDIAQFCATTELSRSALLSLPAAAGPDVRETLRSSAEDGAHHCRDATPAQLGERYADIRIAAEGGVPGAAEELFDMGLPGELAGNTAIDPAVKEWTEHALELVRRDAATGDIGALTALASVYREGSGVATDPARALSYQLTAVEILKAQPQQYSPNEVALQQEFASRAEASAGRDELDAARRAALALVAHCCSGLKH